MTDPTAYPPIIAELLAVRPVAALGPGAAQHAVRDQLAAIDAAFGRAANPNLAACKAGLWLAFNFLDESHRICQTAEGVPDYDFWHAIMHRREPDYPNSKYWWRSVGKHPVLDRLRASAPEVGYPFTTPEAFVDFCERVWGTGSAEEETAKRVQQLEWDLHFAWCFDRVVGM